MNSPTLPSRDGGLDGESPWWMDAGWTALPEQPVFFAFLFWDPLEKSRSNSGMVR